MIDERNDDELDDMDTSPKSEKHEKINQGKSYPNNAMDSRDCVGIECFK